MMPVDSGDTGSAWDVDLIWNPRPDPRSPAFGASFRTAAEIVTAFDAQALPLTLLLFVDGNGAPLPPKVSNPLPVAVDVEPQKQRGDRDEYDNLHTMIVPAPRGGRPLRSGFTHLAVVC